MNIPPADNSNGYEQVYADFVSIRSASKIGVATVREWGRTLPHGGSVLDLGCGHGVPISQTLFELGLSVSGVDASPRMVAAFRLRFPDASVECSAVENAASLRNRFDGVVAWGLMFLLSPDVQASLIHKIAAALNPGGKFLFTAPSVACEWPDTLTGRPSISLGAQTYQQIIVSAGMELVSQTEDEGQNHYYECANRRMTTNR
jgi:2-polyprenyl-3-methyl-5-hydroxy-6-metoxy-1,4-benzoquinol methylase